MSSTTSQGMGSEGSRRQAFDAQSPYLLAPGVLMIRLKLTEQKTRELDAERSAILSEVCQRAVAESGGFGADTPFGKNGELAYRADYENALLAFVVGETTSRLKPIARWLAEQITEVSLDDRHAKARKRRRVSVREQNDGMADLIVHLPAAEAYATYGRLTRMSCAAEGASASSEAISEHASAQRSRDALRADILADLVLTGTPNEEFSEAEAVKAQVQLSVRESGLKDQPAQSSRVLPPVVQLQPIISHTCAVVTTILSTTRGGRSPSGRPEN